MGMIRRSGPKTRVVPLGDPIGYRSTGTPTPPAKYWKFDGATWGTIATNFVASNDWGIKCVYSVDPRGYPANQFVVTGPTNNPGLALSLTSGNAVARFNNDLAGAVAMNGGPFAEGVFHTVEILCRAGSSFLEVDGANAASSTQIPIAGQVISQLGGPNLANALYGWLHSVELIDYATPGNGRWYPMNEGSGSVFRCYLPDKVTPFPAGDATITNYINDSNWQVAP